MVLAELLDLVRTPEGSVVQVHLVLMLLVMVVPEVRPVVVVAGCDDEEEVVDVRLGLIVELLIQQRILLVES